MIFIKKIITSFILLLIIPVSLYINFFIFQLTTWNYVTKAWLIYSALVIISNIIVIFIAKKLLLLFILKFQLINNNYKLALLNNTATAFLLGNFFFIMAIYRGKLWLYVSVFQGFIIFLFGIKFIKKNFIKNNNLPIIKQVFTIKKSNKDTGNINKLYTLLIITILTYILLGSSFQYFIYKSYNPLRKSLIYDMKNFGYKVKF